MAEEALPDDLRCNRTDGRQWRCKRRAMEGKKMCELHHLQLGLRQNRKKVPDSLKLVRMTQNNRDTSENGEIRVRNSGNSTKKKKRVMGESEALDEAVRKMKLKRGDSQLELIRMVLKREAEKRKKPKKKTRKNKVDEKMNDFDYDSDDDSEGEMMRVLPNGIMAISSCSPNRNNADSSCDVELGVEPISLRRRFRSKNIEPLPPGTMQVVPYKGNLVNSGKENKRSCHWCGRKSFRSLISCSSCKRMFFCLDCVKERHIGSREEVELECPVCRGTCGCKVCSNFKLRDAECKDLSRNKNKVERVLHLHYLVCMLLPVLKQMNKDLTVELKEKAKMKGGQQPSELEIQRAESICNQRHCCSNCEVDCSQGSVPQNFGSLICKCLDERKSCEPLVERETVNGDAVISCSLTKVGSCDNGVFALRNPFPLSWTKKLEITAEEIVSSYDLPETVDKVSRCSLCLGMDNQAYGFKHSQEASRRKDSNDNILFYTTILDSHNDKLEHFQRHWVQGHPVIVQGVLLGTSDLSWDPVTMFFSYLKNSTGKSKKDEINKATCHLDWFEVEIGVKQLFFGSLNGHTDANNACQEKLKLKGWLSSRLFHEQFPAHYTEIIDNLPLPHYMDPKSGLLNIAAKLPDNLQTSDFGPCVYISYSSGEELVQADSVIRLCSDVNDMVDILVHATETPVSTKRIYRIQKLMKKQAAQNKMEPDKRGLRQKMDDEMKRSSSLHDENMHELRFVNLNGDKSHRHGGAMKESGLAAETCDLRRKDRGTLHPGTDWSDSGFSSDSEPSKPCSGTKFSSKRFENQGFQVDQGESCNNFGEKENLGKSCGALWDVFRRQDVPKLVEYLRKHSHELNRSCSSLKHGGHPFLDQSFYLDTDHKVRLKEEFEIEPWSFEQHVGEAVIIPSGCPYQIRKLKSCVNVVLKFLSPENVSECIRRTDELHLLLRDHKAIEDKLEVKKMAIHSISAAIDEIRELTTSD